MAGKRKRNTANTFADLWYDSQGNYNRDITLIEARTLIEWAFRKGQRSERHRLNAARKGPK